MAVPALDGLPSWEYLPYDIHEGMSKRLREHRWIPRQEAVLTAIRAGRRTCGWSTGNAGPWVLGRAARQVALVGSRLGHPHAFTDPPSPR